MINILLLVLVFGWCLGPAVTDLKKKMFVFSWRSVNAPSINRSSQNLLVSPLLIEPTRFNRGTESDGTLLQEIRYLVCVLRPEHPLHGLGPQGKGERLSPGLLRLLLLQEAAVHRGGVRSGGGEGALQGSLRLHAGQPQAGGGER